MPIHHLLLTGGGCGVHHVHRGNTPPADGAKVMKIGELPNTIPDYLFTKFPLAVILYQ